MGIVLRDGARCFFSSPQYGKFMTMTNCAKQALRQESWWFLEKFV